MKRSSLNSHLLYVYANEVDRLKLIINYIKEGLAKNELCVLSIPESSKRIKARFKDAGVDFNEAINKGNLRIFHKNQIYQSMDTFTSAYMINNLKDFIKEAKHLGYSGLRTVGDMGWVKNSNDSLSEIQRYETAVNSIDGGIAFSGLCLYPLEMTDNAVFKSIASSHPEVMTCGQEAS